MHKRITNKENVRVCPASNKFLSIIWCLLFKHKTGFIKKFSLGPTCMTGRTKCQMNLASLKKQMKSEDIFLKKLTSISQRERKYLEFKQSTEVTDYVSVQALS